MKHAHKKGLLWHSEVFLINKMKILKILGFISFESLRGRQSTCLCVAGYFYKTEVLVDVLCIIYIISFNQGVGMDNLKDQHFLYSKISKDLMNLTSEFAPNPHTQAHLKCMNCFVKLPANYSGWKKINNYTFFFVCFRLCIICRKTFPTSTTFASNHISDLFFNCIFLTLNKYVINQLMDFQIFGSVYHANP